jgi:hypothetical protein
MKIANSFKIRDFVLIATSCASLSLVSPVSANSGTAYLIDLNSKKVTEIGSPAAFITIANTINDAGQVAGFFDENGFSYFYGFITGPDGMGMTDLGLGEAQDIKLPGRLWGILARLAVAMPLSQDLMETDLRYSE